jgi:hypothetical protein
VVLKSLLGAGFRCLGDLRWVSNRELRQLRYIGIKNVQELRDILRRKEHDDGLVSAAVRVGNWETGRGRRLAGRWSQSSMM